MSKLLIRGGRVICPAQQLDTQTDLLIDGDRIAAIGPAGELSGGADAETIDAAGLIVAPGLIDMHVHFREPGKEEEETIASGGAAAVAGGFTTVATMPNTDPPVDNEAAVAFQRLQGERAALARICPIGCVSAGRAGESLAEKRQMVRAGAVGFSDDGDCVRNARLMRAALQYASMFAKPIIDHCEDKDLVGSGVMHAGYWSTKLGLPGMTTLLAHPRYKPFRRGHPQRSDLAKLGPAGVPLAVGRLAHQHPVARRNACEAL